MKLNGKGTQKDEVTASDYHHDVFMLYDLKTNKGKRKYSNHLQPPTCHFIRRLCTERKERISEPTVCLDSVGSGFSCLVQMRRLQYRLSSRSPLVWSTSREAGRDGPNIRKRCSGSH